MNRPSQYEQGSLAEQNLWLIQLRWVAIAGLVTAALVGSYVFPIFISPVPIYFCAGLLLICNIFDYFAATKASSNAGTKDVLQGMVQVK